MWRTMFGTMALCVALTSCSDDSNSTTTGSEGGPCYQNQTCNTGLLCSSTNICVKIAARDLTAPTLDRPITKGDGPTTKPDSGKGGCDSNSCLKPDQGTLKPDQSTCAGAMCNGVCVDTKKDDKNCGTCGKTCAGGEYCMNGTCAWACATGVSDITVFFNGLNGCAGKVTWPNRASLCNIAAGFHVCSAAEWVANHSIAPNFNFWTNDNLQYNGTGTNSCYATLSGGMSCTADRPMRVCVQTNNGTDAKGNTCNWFNCGYNTNSPIEFFGGCNNDATAGTLCCK